MATTNPWKRFQELLPKTARLIGTVESHNSNGTSTITLRNSGTMTAKGHSVAVGQKVLVENGKEVREVPDLPVSDVQV